MFQRPATSIFGLISHHKRLLYPHPQGGTPDMKSSSHSGNYPSCAPPLHFAMPLPKQAVGLLSTLRKALWFRFLFLPQTMTMVSSLGPLICAPLYSSIPAAPSLLQVAWRKLSKIEGAWWVGWGEVSSCADSTAPQGRWCGLLRGPGVAPYTSWGQSKYDIWALPGWACCWLIDIPGEAARSIGLTSSLGS